MTRKLLTPRILRTLKNEIFPSLEWKINQQWLRLYKRDGKVKTILILLVQQDPDNDSFAALALESSSVGKAILDNHSHKIIGIFKTFKLGIKGAERFAKQWLRQKAPKSKKCDCKEITLKKGKLLK